MAAKENLFLAAERLGKLKAPTPEMARKTSLPDPTAAVEEVYGSDPLPSRFTLVSRTGAFWSYPYALTGLIECESPELIVIHCGSREVDGIEIHGQALDGVAKLLAAQRLLTLRESDHDAFDSDGVTVREIAILFAPEGD